MCSSTTRVSLKIPKIEIKVSCSSDFGLPRLSACASPPRLQHDRSSEPHPGMPCSKSPHPAHYMSFNQGLEHGLACGSVGWCWSVRNT